MKIESVNGRDEQEFEKWFRYEDRLFSANEPACYTDSDEWLMKKGYMAALKAERARSADLLKLANEIIDELSAVAELHPDHTFEKINKLRRGNRNNQHAKGE